MKTPIGKLKRTAVYYLMTPTAHNAAAHSARHDIWGAVVVVALLLGVVGLMRLVLAV